MAQSEELGPVVEEIADRVRRRLQAARLGREEPCAPSPASALAAPSGNREAAAVPDCAPSCDVCPIIDSCATVLGVRSGAARIAPEVIRTSADIAPYIDHTLLKPDATREEVVKLSEEARRFGFATVCVNSANVGTAARILAGSNTIPIAVVGFPIGAALPSAKAFEAREAIRCGAREIDMVINIGALKGKDYALVIKDISSVVDAAKPHPVKVILETSKLTREEKIVGSALAKAAGAAFVKTSTGFGGGGATAEDVALMRSVVGDDVGVKASGGIRTSQDAMEMIEAGANRIGASASVAIVTGGKTTASY
jgi:deoxyribose-phosphate aldolase